MASPPTTIRSRSPRCRSSGAICGFLLALGLLAASPEYGIAAAIVEQSPAGEMLRRLLPGIIVLPLVIGWFAHQAESRTYYDSAATLAIFAVASILVLALFAWTTIGAVRRADRDRNAALMELRGQREWLSTTLASIGDGVIATDPNGSVLLLNKIAEQMTGWSGPEARGPADLGGVSRHQREHAQAGRRPGAEGAARARGDAGSNPARCSSPATSRSCRSSIAARRFSASTARSPARCSSSATSPSGGAPRSASRCWWASSITASRTHSPSCSRWCRRACARRPRGRRRPWPRRSPSGSRRCIAPTTSCLKSQWSGASLKAMVERELEPYRREGGPKIMIKGTDVLLAAAMHLDPRHDAARARHQRGEIRGAVLQ